MRTLLKKCFLRVTLFFAYGLIGSWIFTLIERKNESNDATANRSLKNLKTTMEEKYNLTNMTELDFNEFVEAAYNAIKTRRQKDWTFTNGMGFTFPALTTVGFGDITPKTSLGQGLTIPYCLIGLPLTMRALKTSGEVVLLALRAAMSHFEKKVLGRHHPSIGFLKLFSTIIICQTSIICMFASIEMYTDGWTFLEGVYCWFITFTTIGFGDFVPFSNYIAQNESKIWMFHVIGLLVTFPYIIGLVLLSSLLNLLVESSEKIKMRCGMIFPCSVCKGDVNINNDERTRANTTVMEENELCLEDHEQTPYESNLPDA